MKSASLLSPVGRALKMPIYYLQDYALLAVDSVRIIFTTTRYSTDLIEQMDQIGVGS